ncbi:lysozyme inhibitor LprI family protein [Acetobacter sp. P5B1]|nr:lysozyme inhibitor LprI family protein [Acetobacter sp. P5B1]
MVTKSCAFTFVVILLTLPIYAYAQHMNDPGAPCRGVGPEVKFTSCLFNASQKADMHLQQTVQNIQEKMPGSHLEQLQQMEKTWVLYKNSFCDAEYALYDGASGGPPAHFACLEALTRHHEDELKAAYGRYLD